MKPAARVDVLELFDEERALFLSVLDGLTASEWLAPTICAGWSVKDIAAHVVGDDLGAASGGDGWSAGFIDTTDFDELVAAINAQNEAWVSALRRVSPRLIVEMLRFSGPQAFASYRSRDLDATGPTVDWAGPGPHLAWLHVAREYTERWLHSRQVYDAIAAMRGIEPAPASLERRLMHPVLDAFAHSLPRAYRDVGSPEGTHVRLTVKGPAGCSWSVVRHEGAWALFDDVRTTPAASGTVDQDTAWRMYTKGLPRDTVRRRASIEGDVALGERLLSSAAILA